MNIAYYSNMKQKVCIFLFLCFSILLMNAEDFPVWFTSLRDALYEQNLTTKEILPLYNDAITQAQATLTGQEMYTMLARCEYMMGRAYQYEENKKQAASYYEKGIVWAEKSLDLGESSIAWQMLAENISQSCAVKPTSYAMANGLKVESYAKKALEIDLKNGAAQIMVAARWIYAPSPFNNYKKGIKMMEDIITKQDNRMDKDDEFNVYTAIGYAYFQQKKYQEAKPWLQKSLIVYPSNKFVQDMLNRIG